MLFLIDGVLSGPLAAVLDDESRNMNMRRIIKHFTNYQISVYAPYEFCCDPISE
jgi:hypothetical protein